MAEKDDPPTLNTIKRGELLGIPISSDDIQSHDRLPEDLIWQNHLEVKEKSFRAGISGSICLALSSRA